MLRINHISLRTLMVSLVALLALLAVLAQIMAAQYFRGAAFTAQRQSLIYVVEMASAEVLGQLEAQLVQLGSEIQARAEFRDALGHLQRTGEPGALQAALQDPFEHGFANERTTDLVRLRVFDTQLQPVLGSTSAIAFPPGLPAGLLKQARHREGADRLKMVSALWPLNERAYYSVLLPIGGLRLLGYLEVTANPTHNLRAIEAMTQMPLTIHDGAGHTLESSTRDGANRADMLPVEYILHGSENEPVLRLVSLSDVSQFNQDWQQTAWLAVIAVIVLVGLAALLVLAILNRFVFRPVDSMKREMARFAAGDQSVIVGTNMLSEFAVLADTFNAMSRELAAKIEQLKQLSRYDSLTHLANRQYFDVCIKQEWQRALRSHEPISLLMIDVDHFKRYNDYYGHVGGDNCLRAVADILRQVAKRSTDLPARYGGEEFVLLLPNTPVPSAIALADEILALFKQQNLPHAATELGYVSVSIGVTTCYTVDTCPPTRLIESADHALYEAKHAGRNRLAVAGEDGVTNKCTGCSDSAVHEAD